MCDAECREPVCHVVEMCFAGLGSRDVNLAPVAPVAADLVLLDDIPKITLAGLEETVAAFGCVEVLDAAVTVMTQHEPRVASGRAISDAHAFDDDDRIVGA